MSFSLASYIICFISMISFPFLGIGLTVTLTGIVSGVIGLVKKEWKDNPKRKWMASTGIIICGVLFLLCIFVDVLKQHPELVPGN